MAEAREQSNGNSKDDKDKGLESAHEWLAEVARLLDLPGEVERSSVGPILDLTKDVAHNRSRPSAPVTAFLVGLAAGSKAGGAEPQNLDRDRLVSEIDAAIQTIQRAATD